MNGSIKYIHIITFIPLLKKYQLIFIFFLKKKKKNRKLELHNRSSEPYITLKSIDVLNDIFAHISTKYVIYIRNSENFNYFYFNQEGKYH